MMTSSDDRCVLLESRLLVRGFPGWLSAREKESLLNHFGATEVTVMSGQGKMVSSLSHYCPETIQFSVSVCGCRVGGSLCSCGYRICSNRSA